MAENRSSCGREPTLTLSQSVRDHLRNTIGKLPGNATMNDWYLALAYAVRDRMMCTWLESIQRYTEDVPVVVWLSSEYVNRPLLTRMLVSLGLHEEAEGAMKELGLALSDVVGQEVDPGLGSGDKGVVASSFLESLATRDVPAIGYGARYEFGPFRQEIENGWQVEVTDKWLFHGYPWEFKRPEVTFTVNIGGHTESYYDDQDRFRVRWIPKFAIRGTAYDTPVTGYRSGVINLLRLWRAEAIGSFDYESFKSLDYISAVNEKIATEAISKILYPDDEPYAGKQLRLAQEYFFVSCALQDLIRQHLLRWKPIYRLADSFAVHLNDTAPAIAVAEMMRLLVDEHSVGWEKAWYMTQNIFSFTHYVLLPESLEKWPLPLFAGLLPRHLEIIYEINRRFMDEIWLRYPNDPDRMSRLSLIDESDQKYVRMSHVALLGSHAVSGVSRKQSETLMRTVYADWHELYPERFFHITTGISPRKWMVCMNPRLSSLVTSIIGDGWIKNLDEIRQLESFSSDPSLIRKWQEVKREAKLHLASVIRERTGVKVDPDSLFDVHMKRIHEANRQILTLLSILTQYRVMKQNPADAVVPRTVIFAGKAAPGYFMAQLMVKLVNAVADVINTDVDVAGRLRIVFFPDLNAKNMDVLCSAADLSEQLTTAGREAVGAGAMKMAMNGALMIASRNGIPLEMAEHIGSDHCFLFGLSADEVMEEKVRGYHPAELYRSDSILREILDLIRSGVFSRDDVTLFKPLLDSLIGRDECMVLADYPSYIDSQERVNALYKNRKAWTKASIITVSRMGMFSSDRAVREYCDTVWHVGSLKRSGG